MSPSIQCEQAHRKDAYHGDLGGQRVELSREGDIICSDAISDYGTGGLFHTQRYHRVQHVNRHADRAGRQLINTNDAG